MKSAAVSTWTAAVFQTSGLQQDMWALFNLGKNMFDRVAWMDPRANLLAEEALAALATAPAAPRGQQHQWKAAKY